MTNKERKLIKKKILKCLTKNFEGNQAIFDKKDKRQVFNDTDLDMVMDKVVKGLKMAKHECRRCEFDNAKTLLRELTSDERMELFSDYCKYCGDTDPSCQCWNDE